MKNLSTYINETLKRSHSDHIYEWVLNKDTKKRTSRRKNPYKYSPENKKDLRKIINKRYISNSTLNLNDIFTIKITDMSYLFSDFTQLESIDISDWKIINVETFESMFENCPNLKEIKGIEKWEINDDVNLKNMFKGCNESVIPSWYDKQKWETQ